MVTLSCAWFLLAIKWPFVRIYLSIDFAHISPFVFCALCSDIWYKHSHMSLEDWCSDSVGHWIIGFVVFISVTWYRLFVLRMQGLLDANYVLAQSVKKVEGAFAFLELISNFRNDCQSTIRTLTLELYY